MAPTGFELEQPIRAMIDATNRGDVASFLDAFADDGANSRIDVTGVQREGDEVRVGVSVSGDGYRAQAQRLEGARSSREAGALSQKPRVLVAFLVSDRASAITR